MLDKNCFALGIQKKLFFHIHICMIKNRLLQTIIFRKKRFILLCCKYFKLFEKMLLSISFGISCIYIYTFYAANQNSNNKLEATSIDIQVINLMQCWILEIHHSVRKIFNSSWKSISIYNHKHMYSWFSNN